MLELADKNVKAAVITNYIQGHKVKYAYNKWENKNLSKKLKSFKKTKKNILELRVYKTWTYVYIHTHTHISWVYQKFGNEKNNHSEVKDRWLEIVNRKEEKIYDAIWMI